MDRFHYFRRAKKIAVKLSSRFSANVSARASCGRCRTEKGRAPGDPGAAQHFDVQFFGSSASISSCGVYSTVPLPSGSPYSSAPPVSTIRGCSGSPYDCRATVDNFPRLLGNFCSLWLGVPAAKLRRTAGRAEMVLATCHRLHRSVVPGRELYEIFIIQFCTR